VVRKEHILTYVLTEEQVAVARGYAESAELGGYSSVRSRNDRMNSLSEDQVIGQLGTLAGHLWLYGHDVFYRQTREMANADPWKGDGGCDVPGRKIDFKTSLMRAGDDPTKYRLPLRPRERHPEWVYILILVAEHSESSATIHLVGWAAEHEFPQSTESGGPFAGAHVIRVPYLHPLQPFSNTPLPTASDNIVQILADRNITPYQLAMVMCIREEEVPGLLDGTTLITHDLAVKLANALGNSPEFWLGC